MTKVLVESFLPCSVRRWYVSEDYLFEFVGGFLHNARDEVFLCSNSNSLSRVFTIRLKDSMRTK